MYMSAPGTLTFPETDWTKLTTWCEFYFSSVKRTFPRATSKESAKENPELNIFNVAIP